MEIRTRFAPSPSGNLHLGGARTALFSWLLARQSGGKFFLRIEDTDEARSTDISVHAILEGLKWLKLTWDGKVVYQSKRLPRYREIIQSLVKKGHAYRCYCTPKELDKMRLEQRARGEKPHYDRRCLKRKDLPKDVSPVTRMKLPNTGEIGFDDIVHGHIKTPMAELDDFIIGRSNGVPTYNLTVAIDDTDMRITHVVRGDDHISNTPKQLFVYRAMQISPPQFAHIPMITDATHSRLSKRKGHAGLDHYCQEGYVAEAVLNFLLRLGWSHKNQEIFDLEEMIKMFSLGKIGKSAAIFDINKLRWLNTHYLSGKCKAEWFDTWQGLLANETDQTTLGTQGSDLSVDWMKEAYALLRGRYPTLVEMAKGARFLYHDDIAYDPAELKRTITQTMADVFAHMKQEMKKMEIWGEREIKELLANVQKHFGMSFKELGKPLRYVLIAGMPSPSLASTMKVMGKVLCMRRLSKIL